MKADREAQERAETEAKKQEEQLRQRRLREVERKFKDDLDLFGQLVLGPNGFIQWRDMLRINQIQMRALDDLFELRLAPLEKARQQAYLRYKVADGQAEYQEWKKLAIEYLVKKDEIVDAVFQQIFSQFEITNELLQESWSHLNKEGLSELEQREKRAYEEELARQERNYKQRKMEDRPKVARDLCKRVFMASLDDTEGFYDRLLKMTEKRDPGFLEQYKLSSIEMED